MSERYGACKRCFGSGRMVIGVEMDGTKAMADCQDCGSTGFDGSIAALDARAAEFDPGIEMPSGKGWDK